jgi:hypothetical protein
MFAPEIALKAEGSDPARNNLFRADILNAHLQCRQFLRNCGKIKAVYRKKLEKNTDDLSQLWRAQAK